MAAPLFFFGFQRSGTTLFSTMLDSHPDLAVPFSLTGLWLKTGERLGAYNHLSTRRDLEALIDDLLTRNSRLWLWNIPLNRDAILEGLPLGDYPALIARFHTLYAHHHGKSRWGHFDISTLTAPHQLLSWFPEAQFVHLVRDARDVALSNQGIPYGLSNMLECAEHWATDVGQNIAWGKTVSRHRYHIVRYEDLVQTPEETLKALCAFMDVSYAPAMLAYAQNVPGRVPDDTRHALWPLLDKPLETAQAGRWKTDMTPAQQGVVTRVAGPILRDLGYDAPIDAPYSIASRLLAKLYATGRGGRWPRLARRLGLHRSDR